MEVLVEFLAKGFMVMLSISMLGVLAAMPELLVKGVAESFN